ncbi:CLUMA_CG004802, isoform A [Clunio marinus]|uniref:CLUMA_CG004802, isoform A n=1 Tax=Clunio marinus TaxID=568069 RepID=A0A1J1HU83_9DIPT|nr:CLUMA_CG004802, isoform A [Clunio marinus]
MKFLFAFVLIAFIVIAVHTAIVPNGEKMGSQCGSDLTHNIEKRDACRNLTSIDEVDNLI